MNILNKYIEESRYNEVVEFMNDAYHVTNKFLDLLINAVNESDKYSNESKKEVSDLAYDIIIHGLYYKTLIGKKVDCKKLPMEKFLEEKLRELK